jgi:hypothetical protein
MRGNSSLMGVVIVKYTPELYALTIVSGATALMWVPYVSDFRV